MSRRMWSHRVIPPLLALGLLGPSVALGQGIEANRRPLRTSLAEIATLRTAYVDAFNKKDHATITAMFAPEAIIIYGDGTMASGWEAIGKAMADSSVNWNHAVVASDTVRIYGNTAIDIGTWTHHPKEGGEEVTRYTVLSRRGMKGWTLQHVVLVPMPKPKSE